MRLKAIDVTLAAVLAAAPAVGGELKVEPDQVYLLLATNKTSTMQKELSEASKLGFRIVEASPGSDELVYLLKRADAPDEGHDYKLLATTKIDTMEKELNEEAQAGYRLVPVTMMSKKGMFGPKEMVVVLEPAPGEKRYEYGLVGTNRTGTLQKEITEFEQQGYSLTFVATINEHTAIMEREISGQN
jgi:hypothetical protein